MSSVNLNVGINNSEFRKGMTQINTDLKNAQSQFNLASARARAYGTETDQLGAKQQNLSAKMDLQNSKIKLIKGSMADTQAQIDKFTQKQTQLASEIDKTSQAYDESVAASGKSSEESKKLKDQLDKLKKSYAQTESSIDKKRNSLTKLETEMNNNSAELVKMEAELKDVDKALENVGNEATDTAGDLDKLDKSVSDNGKSLDDAGNKSSGWGSKLKSAGGLIATGLTAAVGAGIALTGALGKLAIGAGDTALEITKFSAVTGHSTDEYQRWDTVLKSTGYSMEAASGDIAALSEKMLDASEGGKENSAMFEKLGVAVTDSSGKLRTQEEVFNDVVSGLQGIENESERAAIATALLSTTGEELAPILNMTAEELKAMKDNVNVISEEDLQKASEFKLQWEGVKTSFGNLVTQIGIGVMPMFSGLLDKVQEVMPVVQDVIGIALGDSETKFQDMATAMGLPAETFTGLATSMQNVYDTMVLPLIDGIKWLFDDMVVKIGENIGSMESYWTDLGSIYNDVWVEVIQPIWDLFMDVVFNAWLTFNNNIGSIMGLFATFGQFMRDVFDTMIMPLISGIRGLFDDMATEIGTHIGNVQIQWFDLGAIFNTVWETIIKPVWDLFMNIVFTVWSVFNDNIGNIIGLFTTLGDIINTTWETIIKPVFDLLMEWVGKLKATFDEYLPEIQRVVEEVFTAIQGVIDAVFAAIDSLWNNVLKPVFEDMGWYLENIVAPAWDWVFNNVILPIVDGVFKTIIDLWDNSLKPVFTGITDFLNGVFSADWELAWEGIKGIFEGVVGWYTTTSNNFKATISTIFSNAWNSIMNTAKSILGGIGNWIGGILTSAKGIIVGKINQIKTSFFTGFNTAKTTVLGIFDGIKNGIYDKIDWARQKVRDVIDKIKGFFNFSWSLPELKMPHVSMTGEFSLLPPSVPKFDISWYSEGAIFNKRTLLPGGIGVGDDHRGVGNNPEAIVPLDSLYRNMESIVDRSNKNDNQSNSSTITLVIENFNNNRETDIERLVEEIEFYSKQKSRTR